MVVDEETKMPWEKRREEEEERERKKKEEEKKKPEEKKEEKKVESTPKPKSGGEVVGGGGGDRAHWVDQDTVSECMKCGVAFGFFTRKHHCRSCGDVLCSKCSSKEAYVPQVRKGGVEGRREVVVVGKEGKKKRKKKRKQANKRKNIGKYWSYI